jgi:DNA helicase HerA-like ATPase
VKKVQEIEIAGQVVAGDVANILVREKSGKRLELGDLLVAEEGDGGLLILKVYGLVYGSQIPQLAREMASGLKLEGLGGGLEYFEPHLRNYVIAEVKAVAQVINNKAKIPKSLPAFFSAIRHIKKEDLSFLAKPENPIFFGNVRSGSKVLDVPVFLNGSDVFTHHVLIPATTGRGKSNLVKVLLWNALGSGGKFGILVLDPHDEYYGRPGKGLKDHPKAKQDLVYFSTTPVKGANTLVINLQSIKPWYFDGIVRFTDAQNDAIDQYYNAFNNAWIENLIRATPLPNGVTIAPRTLGVLRRKFDSILGIYIDDAQQLQCRSRVFSDSSGETTMQDIINSLEAGKIVVIDTSRLLDQAELLIGSIIVGDIFSRYQKYKSEGTLNDKPVISIVIEEAPRVLGTDVLESAGDNIYSTIAREGRKFKVGLTAITQLTSVIPRTVLTNINTKIILGNEMSVERKAVIDSASQDLSDEDRTIASLDKGEAIISSSFVKFAIPIQIPLIDEILAGGNESANGPRKRVVG